MEPHKAYTVALLLILSLSLNSKVIYGDSSVLLLDSPTRHYFRHSSDQSVSLFPSENGAMASVLLGFAPSSSLTATGSSKLNEVLMPNPFDRPRALLMVEVTGVEESQLITDSDKSPFDNALRVKVEGSQKVDIQLPDEEVSMVSLNGVSSDAECSDKELSDFASWLGGSYVEDASQALNGELVIPLANGAFLRLQMSERADREFSTSLVSLINNIRKAMEMHQVLKKGDRSPAELITGRFDGIKTLQNHYGKEDGISQSGLEVFINSISKIFGSLQEAYQGQIVGVIGHGGLVESESGNMFHFTVNSRQSARVLEEMDTSPESLIIAEILFVRKTLAWITGIILLIATILGIHFLMNMPLTKDTLLYSNVKLD